MAVAIAVTCSAQLGSDMSVSSYRSVAIRRGGQSTGIIAPRRSARSYGPFPPSGRSRSIRWFSSCWFSTCT